MNSSHASGLVTNVPVAQDGRAEHGEAEKEAGRPGLAHDSAYAARTTR